MHEPEVAGCGPAEAALKDEIIRLNKIVLALMDHAESSTSGQADDVSLFHSAIMLEEQVRNRTEELQRRQERLEVALQATNTGLWQWEPITRDVYFSPTFFTMLGYPPGALAAVQSTWTRLVHPDDWLAVLETFRTVARSSDDIAFSHEYRMRSAPGAWRWILTRGKIVRRDERGRVSRVVGVNTDITEPKVEDKRLQMAMRALDRTRESVSWLDEYGRMLYVNPATELELGYSAAELQQMTIPDIDPNTPAEGWGPDGELTRIMKASGLRKFETLHRHRDGHLIPVEVDSDAFIHDGQTYFIAIARDVTERRLAEAAVRKSEAKFAAMFSLTPDPMALTRLADGVVLEVSRSYAEFFGYRRDQVVGRTTLPGGLGFWVDAEQRREWKDKIERDGEALAFETPLRRKDGSVGTVLISGKRVEMDGEPCVIVTIHDISERQRHAEHLDQIAHHDPLTGLPNRLLLGDRLRQALAQNRRTGTRMAVCYLDLDGFKEVNDRFGHQAGDQVLIEVARRLACGVRANDTVARLGGDEFVVLLSGLADDDECHTALGRLLQTVAAPYTVGDGEYADISASIGVTLFPNDPADSDTLVRHADHAMYVAKQAGKNRCQFFDTHLEQRIEARHATLRRLTEALALTQFRLYYQPKVDCRQGRIVGAEALIRWQHPTLGLLSPGEFIPLIEEAELALPVGEWVIREALAQVVRLRRASIELPISVNAFLRHLLQPDFSTTLAAILNEYPEAGPGALQIEIVETAAIKDIDAIRQVIEDCGKLGVTFSLDDFGTGYSTLAHLRHLPAAEIKIDQTFVRHMLKRAEDLAIVDAVIGMARAFGRAVVAEGVETPAHINRLLALGCDVMQGYALARPMPAEEFLRWVEDFKPDAGWHSPAGNIAHLSVSQGRGEK